MSEQPPEYPTGPAGLPTWRELAAQHSEEQQLHLLWKARAKAAEATLLEVAALVDEVDGYAVPYKRSRFVIDSAFTSALRKAMGVPPAGSCITALSPAGTASVDG